jgi:hypothetical protein
MRIHKDICNSNIYVLRTFIRNFQLSTVLAAFVAGPSGTEYTPKIVSEMLFSLSIIHI